MSADLSRRRALAALLVAVGSSPLVSLEAARSQAIEPPGKKRTPALNCRTPVLVAPYMIPGDPRGRRVRSMDLRVDGTGRGDLIFDLGEYDFNDFGDPIPGSPRQVSKHAIRLEPVPLTHESERLYGVVFENGDYPHRFYVVVSTDDTKPDRLLVRPGNDDPVAIEGLPRPRMLDLRTGEESAGDLTLRYDAIFRLDTGDAKATPDRDHDSARYRSADIPVFVSPDSGHHLSYVALSLTDERTGDLMHERNHRTFDPFGNVSSITLVFYPPQRFSLRQLPAADSSGEGRQLFELVPRGRAGRTAHAGGLDHMVSEGQYRLVRTRSGPDRLLMFSNGKLEHVVELYVAHSGLPCGFAE